MLWGKEEKGYTNHQVNSVFRTGLYFVKQGYYKAILTDVSYETPSSAN